VKSGETAELYSEHFFSSGKIRPVFPSMLQVGKEWEQYVRSLGLNTEVDAKDICSRYTTETMLRCTFSINGGSFEKQSEFLDAGKAVFNPDPITGLKLMLWFFIPAIQRIISISVLPKKMSRSFMNLVRDQIRIRDAESVKSEDVLQYILNGREKYEMSEKQITGICVSFFTEAYETSSNALSLALYQLAKNPHIQDELARRIEESIAENNNEITYDLIHKHQYLEMVLFETMRIQPIFFGLQKLCTKPYTMPLLPGQKEPVTIPVGTPILVPFATVSQDPSIFPDPDGFDPERFSPEQKAMRQKSAFMPFSDGPRMCIGMHLALFNLKMGLFQMVRLFDIKFGPNQKPFKLHPMAFFNVPKDGIKLVFTPRKSLSS